MKVSFRWQGYRYFPYERSLARQELRALFGVPPLDEEDGLQVEVADSWEQAALRTTYFHEVVGADGQVRWPLQALLEGSANGLNGRRQQTRYSAHGIHDYRGKFNPQIVRAVGNLLGIEEGQWVFDPFCGSGTTILEAAHCGWNAVGLDMNPLGVLITQAKIAALRVPAKDLLQQVGDCLGRLERRASHVPFDSALTEAQMVYIAGKNWRDSVPDYAYLRSWFAESVLAQIQAIQDQIAVLPSADVRLILRVILSDILRQVSAQDPGDLRIRRRKVPPENAPAIALFALGTRKKTESIAEARRYLRQADTTQRAVLGDARGCASIVREHVGTVWPGSFDAVITSPPYATALPYIDTQRLSLVALGLVRATEIRAVERRLVGDREIGGRERLVVEDELMGNAGGLPTECASLCQRMWEAVNSGQDGFRRRNVPALLYRYLSQMKCVCAEVSGMLRHDGPFAIVIGRNTTTLGRERFDIDTPRLLSLVAQDSGFVLSEAIELDTYHRYDVHQTNSIRSETLLMMRKGGSP